MTRALITDPDLPAKARSGRLDELVRCIGCNACIAHYHARHADPCAINPRPGASCTSHARPCDGAAASGSSSSAAGRPGSPRRSTPAARGHEVVLLERSGRLGGQIALAGAAPGGRGARGGVPRQRRPAAHRTRVELAARSSRRRLTPCSSSTPDAVVVATGARPYRGRALALDGSSRPGAGTCSRAELPLGRRVLVADWGGDPSGLDAAEVLAAAGKQVTLAVASVAAGELVHQYRRNLYLQRLYRAGVTILHHLELESVERRRGPAAQRLRARADPDRAGRRRRARARPRARGRRSRPSSRARASPSSEAGDCRSPRSLEEAVLEGTLAARDVFA